ncbi:MAG: 50S ribosomal protein L18 [Candidatus Zixiibacteriota bacterium]
MRHRRTMRVRKPIVGTADRPRLAVHRSLNGMYVQIIDDTQGVTLAAASTRDPVVIATLEPEDTRIKKSFKVGLKIAELAKEKGIEAVAFDRHGFLYHGRIKAVADGARKGGLKL